ncbi:MgtC/SapB family protein [Massilia sp. W12]|uniref:MgtC/SapB family protein n=1 Tax=Massilia sp. W12 TaxID=3126507 RepID=UPI0030D62B66
MLTLPQLLIALGCGLIIGIERERRKAAANPRAFAGVRTFALTALAGALAGAWNLALPGALLVGGLCLIAYWRQDNDDRHITTHLALFMAYLLGAGSLANPAVSAGAAVMIAITLHWSNALHRFLHVSLKTDELRDALWLAAAALVALPLLPDAPQTWLLGANPRRLWGLVVLLMCLQAAGYVALRISGPRLGLALSGFGSGFVSSTATTAAMGLRAKQQPELMTACVSGALLSTVATFVLLLVVCATVAPAQLANLAPSFVAALLCACGVAGFSLLRHAKGGEFVQPKGRAFSLREALAFALILSVATASVSFAHTYFGAAAVLLGAALAGLVDVHAAAASLLTLLSHTALPDGQVQLAILLAVSSNTCSKILAASMAGGAAFAWRTGGGLILILLAAWAPYVWRLLA